MLHSFATARLTPFVRREDENKELVVGVEEEEGENNIVAAEPAVNSIRLLFFGSTDARMDLSSSSSSPLPPRIVNGWYSASLDRSGDTTKFCVDVTT
jgi:hypothetical protein